MVEYKCNVCNKNFKTDKTLSVHINKYHPDGHIKAEPTKAEPVKVKSSKNKKDDPAKAEPIKVKSSKSKKDGPKVKSSKDDSNDFDHSAFNADIFKTKPFDAPIFKKKPHFKPPPFNPSLESIKEHKGNNKSTKVVKRETYNDGDKVVNNVVTETVNNKEVYILNFLGVAREITYEQWVKIITYAKNKENALLVSAIKEAYNVKSTPDDDDDDDDELPALENNDNMNAIDNVD